MIKRQPTIKFDLLHGVKLLQRSENENRNFEYLTRILKGGEMTEFLTKVTILIAISIFTFEVGISQDVGDPTPGREKFSDATGLMVPWRSGGCILMGRANKLSSCYLVTFKQYDQLSRVSLFNENGSLWHVVDVRPENPGYFWTDPILKDELVPYSTGRSSIGGKELYPQLIVLRIIAESPHWYQVVVNERTGAIKYVKRSDELWKRTTWDHWLADGFDLYLPNDHPPLLDGPNGKVVPESAELRFTRVFFVRTDGDWAYVYGRELVSGKLIAHQYGWIRWRKGTHLHVGCLLNNFIVPEPEEESSEPQEKRVKG